MSKKFETNSRYAQYDSDGDGIVTDNELAQAERLTRLENEDKKEDAQRNMAWFALFGMVLYPFAVIGTEAVGLTSASSLLGDMASTYFMSVAAIVAAFYAKEGYTKAKQSDSEY